MLIPFLFCFQQDGDIISPPTTPPPPPPPPHVRVFPSCPELAFVASQWNASSILIKLHYKPQSIKLPLVSVWFLQKGENNNTYMMFPINLISSNCWKENFFSDKQICVCVWFLIRRPPLGVFLDLSFYLKYVSVIHSFKQARKHVDLIQNNKSDFEKRGMMV